MRFADPKNDIAFKKIFGNENKKEILISFLNAVSDLQGQKAIIDIEILNPYQAPKLKDLKETNLDIRAKNQEGITFIVEMQVEKQVFFDKRALYYTSKAYISQIERGDNYPRLNQVIFIGIMDFSIFEGADYLSKHLIMDQKTLQQTIKDFEFNFIELSKFHKQSDELESPVDKWVFFFKHAGNINIVPKPLSETPEIVEAFQVAEQYNWTEEELAVYDYWEMKEAARKDAMETAVREATEQGIQQGIQQGQHKEKVRVAQNLPALGVEVETIIEATQLSREVIEQLRHSV